MKHTFESFLFPFLMAVAVAACADDWQRPRCLMEPTYTAINVPEQGLAWLGNQPFEGDCDVVPSRSWIRSSTEKFDLLVYADGPIGSGRFWHITVGMRGKQERGPMRGFCFEASTVGWRTLQQFKRSPLPWAADLDGNRRPELIIWSSFPLREDASLAEFGLMAWVYQVDPKGIFTIDWGLSRQMARELASAYRKPLEPDTPLQALRNDIAQFLEAFAAGACTCERRR